MKRALEAVAAFLILALTVLAVTFAVLSFATCASADGPYPETVAKRVKTVKPKAKAKPKAATVPTPQCLWTPETPEPCNCYFKRSAMDGGPQWDWRECAPAPVELLLTEPAVVLEVPPPTFNVPPPSLPEEQPGMSLRMEAWSLAGLSGEADRSLTVGGRLLVDGPLAHAWSKRVRMFTRLDLSALPGETVDFTAPETFGRSAELRGGIYMQLAETTPAAQRITTSIVAWGGFATVLKDEQLDRYLRSGGVGLRLAEEMGGAEVTLSWCRDEAAGWIGPVGQVCIGGSVPIVGTRGTLVLGGNAVLNLSRATVSPQRDVFRLWVGASIGDLVNAVRR